MDELQKKWKVEQVEMQQDFPELPDLHKEPTSIIEKMKKRLKHEDKANYLIGLILLVYFIVEGWYGFSGIFLALLIPVFWYYRYLIRQLEYDPYAMDVVHFLQRTTRIISAFVMRYRIFGYVVVPVGFISGLIMGISEEGEFEISKFLEWELLLVSIITLTLFMIVIEVYIWIMYGRLLKKLKSLLKELE